jgi:hypothetical protein
MSKGIGRNFLMRIWRKERKQQGLWETEGEREMERSGWRNKGAWMDEGGGQESEKKKLGRWVSSGIEYWLKQLLSDAWSS